MSYNIICANCHQRIENETAAKPQQYVGTCQTYGCGLQGAHSGPHQRAPLVHVSCATPEKAAADEACSVHETALRERDARIAALEAAACAYTVEQHEALAKVAEFAAHRPSCNWFRFAVAGSAPCNCGYADTIYAFDRLNVRTAKGD